MRSKFDEQLNILNQKLIQMGQAIESNIQDAIDALINGNVEKANQIIVDQEGYAVKYPIYEILKAAKERAGE